MIKNLIINYNQYPNEKHCITRSNTILYNPYPLFTLNKTKRNKEMQQLKEENNGLKQLWNEERLNY